MIRTKKQITFSHPTGNANVRHAARALSEVNFQVDFHTTIGIHEGDFFWKLADTLGIVDIKRRSYARYANQKMIRHPGLEMIRMLSNKLGVKSLTQHESGLACVDNVYLDLDSRVARSLKQSLSEAVYAYEDAALKSFKMAREMGIQCLYDLPIGYWRAGKKIQMEEALLRPEWAMTMPAIIDSDDKLARKDEELKLANVITVASSFTRKTLEDAPFPIAPVTVIPYGGPQFFSTEQRKSQRDSSKPLKILFVGSLGQRKGLADLLEAVDALGTGVELTLIGQLTSTNCAPLSAALQKHRWIPSLPHQGILEEMSNHHVFVFPSLFEGFGLVILEAMSRGVPVITTTNTAGPDIITDGIDGFIVPIRSVDAICDKLELLRTDPSLLAAMSEEAVKTAAKFSWERYRSLLAEWLLNCLKAT